MHENSQVFSGKNILIAEDDEGLLELLAEELTFHGANVFQAKNGEEAFKILNHRSIDCIVSDVRMPGGDGIDLLKRIREIDFAHPGLLFVTGYADLSKMEAFELGAEAVISKPFDLNVLSDTIERVLTPKEIQWNHPLTEGNFVHILKRNYYDITQVSESHEIRIGRGGMFIKADDVIPDIPLNSIIKLCLEFEEGALSKIEGFGKLMWLRKTDKNGIPAGLGIEFEFLTQNAAKQLNQWINQLKPKSYIPSN